MGAYKYITATLQKQYKERGADFRDKVMNWRKGDAIVRVERPSNIARARTLGYKAKQGYAVVRVRIDKGRRTRIKPMGGRKHKNNYRFVQPGMSHQAIAEQRVNRVYKNMEVLNSYWVGEDGMFKYFEVLLADASKPSVNISSVIRTGKAFRGLTSAGNSRGPSRKKQINKKLQRKLAAKRAFHFIPYVKTEAKPEAQKPVAKPAPKPYVRQSHDQKAAEHEHKAAEHEHKAAEHEHKAAEHKLPMHAHKTEEKK